MNAPVVGLSPESDAAMPRFHEKTAQVPLSRGLRRVRHPRLPHRGAAEWRGRTWVVKVMGFERLDCLAGKEVTHGGMEVTHGGMEELGPVIPMDGKRFDRGLTSEGRMVMTQRIRADLGKPGLGVLRVG